MRRLTLSFAISILLTLPALTQRNPNANAGGGSNAGGGESRETVAAPRESGGGYSGGGYTGGGSVSGSGGSREPSSPSRDSGGGMSSSGGSVSNSGGSREPSSPVHSSDGGNARGGGSVSGGRGPGGDIGDREFNSRGHQGKPTNVPTAQPGSPASQLQNKLPASRTAQP
ncbi:MAG TPA: hypothetical protein VE825_14145, partial [Terriglobales bacterium]|nr:hypothetical protein [Terriglobales bacterium]